MSLRTGAGFVRTRAFIILVLGAVVEDAFDQTHAGGSVHQALSGAQTLLVTHPAGGQGPGQCALSAAAFPTRLTHHQVLLLSWRGGDQRQCVLAYARTRPSAGHLCRLEVQRFGGGGARRAEAFRLRGRETARGAADCVDHAVG